MNLLPNCAYRGAVGGELYRIFEYKQYHCLAVRLDPVCSTLRVTRSRGSSCTNLLLGQITCRESFRRWGSSAHPAFVGARAAGGEGRDAGGAVGAAGGELEARAVARRRAQDDADQVPPAGGGGAPPYPPPHPKRLRVLEHTSNARRSRGSKAKLRMPRDQSNGARRKV